MSSVGIGVSRLLRGASHCIASCMPITELFQDGPAASIVQPFSRHVSHFIWIWHATDLVPTSGKEPSGLTGPKTGDYSKRTDASSDGATNPIGSRPYDSLK